MIIKRMLPVARQLATLQRSSCSSRLPVCYRAMSSYDHPPKDYVYPTMDDADVPCGDWKENYEKNQRKYNLHLLFGIGFFTITCVVGYYSGYFWANAFYPDRPGPRPEPVNC